MKGGDIAIIHPDILSEDARVSLERVAKEAFPGRRVIVLDEGMRIEPVDKPDLRDWFAGKALGGILSNYGDGNPDAYARDSYAYADAMILARVKH